MEHIRIPPSGMFITCMNRTYSIMDTEDGSDFRTIFKFELVWCSFLRDVFGAQPWMVHSLALGRRSTGSTGQAHVWS
jgi:hypothetical protein